MLAPPAAIGQKQPFRYPKSKQHMRLLPHQQNINAMRELSSERIDLLGARQFECLVERYAHVQSFGRSPFDAVWLDLDRTLSAVSGDGGVVA
jgi:hypothetical protein